MALKLEGEKMRDERRKKRNEFLKEKLMKNAEVKAKKFQDQRRQDIEEEMKKQNKEIMRQQYFQDKRRQIQSFRM